MADENSKKTLWMVLAGAGALIGAALVLNYLNGDSSESHDDISKALEKSNIKQPVHDANGQLETKYFLELLQFVGEQTRAVNHDVRKKLTDERRKHYDTENWEEYEKCIK